MFGFDTFASLFVIIFVKFKADKVPLLLDAGNGGSSAAHAVVKDGIALVGVGADEIGKQFDWFLRGMQPRFGVELLPR